MNSNPIPVSTAIALLAALAVTAPGSARAQEDPATLLASGRDAYEAGDWEAAREDLWAYLDATAGVIGPSRLPQAEALYYIALMEPDAAVAARHYETIVEDYPAASVADRALFRLALYALVDDRPREARERLEELRQNYPFSEVQPEIPLWTGRTLLVEGGADAAIEAFLRGYTSVKSQDLPQELSRARREALSAEYVWWLATAYRESGDRETANQYLALLTLDYPDSPQAADAREALAGREAPVEAMARADAREEIAVDEPEPEAEKVPGEVQEPLVVVREEPAAEPEPEPERVPDETERERAEPEVAPERGERPRGPAAELDQPAKFPPEATRGAAWLQVGAFTSASNAADLSKRLKADGFDSRVEVGIVDGRGYYRVRVGPFRLPNEDARLAEQRERLESLGYPVRLVSGGE
ncbi:MAG: SPOR domain-containing protein [Gemmatimonadota bacterium]|nr:SPOR domain-containing protein [Gemmatimonadota bacterium]